MRWRYLPKKRAAQRSAVRSFISALHDALGYAKAVHAGLVVDVYGERIGRLAARYWRTR